ncbi:MAG: hypothetical protein Q8943_17460, partial [Bacteroidota bacterium]|nr:hypothetical protein [Bacteroidota bacterium]
MNWNLAISGVPSNPANFLVAALYDGGVLAFHQTVPKPGGGYTGATITITFAGVDAIVYEFKLWESVDASPAGTVLSDFSLQPSANT